VLYLNVDIRRILHTSGSTHGRFHTIPDFRGKSKDKLFFPDDCGSVINLTAVMRRENCWSCFKPEAKQPPTQAAVYLCEILQWANDTGRKGHFFEFPAADINRILRKGGGELRTQNTLRLKLPPRWAILFPRFEGRVLFQSAFL
jgi:hypothetical protein